MKKALVTTRVNNYFPELCQYTMPNLKRYADNIGADFIEIVDRIYPEAHPAYEKLQVHKIAPYYDKTLLIDADMLFHPRMADLTEGVAMDQVGIWLQYKIKDTKLNLWETMDNKYFIKDGRNLGIAGCMVGCTKFTYDLFEPLPSMGEVLEMQTKIYRPAIIDEYTMSLNLAKYSFKVGGIWHPWFGSLIYHAEMTTKNPTHFLDTVKKIVEEWQ